MRAVNLTKGMQALVDDEDFESVSASKWQAVNVSERAVYARRAATEDSDVKEVYLHRFIMRPGPGMVVDHINGDGLDNRRSNLRVCSPSENQWNRKGPNRDGTSGYMGVTFNKKSRKWTAKIYGRGKGSTYIGSFHTAEEAARAYDEEVKKFRGDGAFLNFPD